KTLNEWQRGRPLREILDAYVPAGRGLLAAHRAGLVHRDFKPQNVLVRGDGRVCVGDFGLARTIESAEPAPEDAAIPSGLDRSLPPTGALLGPPAFMAPEVRAGTPADARSDQFSYCVALYQALHGELPDAARPPQRSTAVPAWIRGILARGLSAQP